MAFVRPRAQGSQAALHPLPSQEREPKLAASAAPTMRTMTTNRFRWAWWLLAYASLGVGIAGIFIPLLPTTVFILISAWAATRGSDRLHRWLLAHRAFGPLIVDWQAHGAVSRRAKRMATLAMAACAVVMWLAAPRVWMAATGIACMAIGAVWLWRRPEPPADRQT